MDEQTLLGILVVVCLMLTTAFRGTPWARGPLVVGMVAVLAILFPPVRYVASIAANQIGPLVGLASTVGEDKPSDHFYSGITVKYRVTATVRVNGELRSASSLQVVKVNKQITFGANYLKGSRTEFAGEAVLVPITNGQYLMVAMRGARNSADNYEGFIAEPCPEMSSPLADIDAFLLSLAAFRGSCEIALDRLPLLVRIGDLTDVNSLKKVQVGTLSQDFGAQVEFVSLRFAVVDDPAALHLKDQIRWLDGMGKGRLGLRPVNITSGDMPDGIYPWNIWKVGNLYK